MKTKLNLFQTGLLGAVALGSASCFSLAAAAADAADSAPAKTSIPWSRIGARAGAEYQGDGLSVSATPEGARLRCVFQRLEGEATREGLWLTSTVPNAGNDRFRVVAVAVRRGARADAGNVGSADLQSAVSPNFIRQTLDPPNGRRITNPRYGRVQLCATSEGALPCIGQVSVDGKLVRFFRPGLVEEYRVGLP